MKIKESVLCIPRANLPGEWTGAGRVLRIDEELFLTTCSIAGFKWVERSIAESDPSLKQIIPYVVIVSKCSTFQGSYSSPLMAIYRRKGSEKRLHDLYSIGIGGHINPMDCSSSSCSRSHSTEMSNSFREILYAGMKRELDEEFLKRPLEEMAIFHGIINEEVTDVGKVHLGALFVIYTESPRRFVPGSELVEFEWMKRDNIVNLNLELWSAMALQIL